ncbi:MAG TPA: hypothetical protein PKI32_06295, partial [Opitutales bacterium]|nr:hypothetical protein [Opitutales bacterium]
MSSNRRNFLLRVVWMGAMAFAADCSGATGTVSEIPLLEGERWYGGAVNLGDEQPWTRESSTKDVRYGRRDYDLANSCWGGAVTPFLVSD